MTQQIINIGALPNDGSGDPLRTAFTKINSNFTELFATDFSTAESYTVGDTPNQVIFEYPLATFTQGKFQINSSNPDTQDSQNITIAASKKNNGTSVRFTGYGTIFEGTPVTTYDMDVSGGNVRILCSPFTTSLLVHFLAYQVTYVGDSAPGMDMALDGYPVDNLLTSEGDLILTTET